MKENIFRKPIVVWALALVCCALWGSAFSAVKAGYEAFSVDTSNAASLILFGGFRFTVAGVLAIIIGSALSKQFLVPTKRSLPKIGLLSICQTVGQYFFFYIGLANSTGVRASILDGMSVFVAIFLACVLFRQENLTARKIIGSIIGFAGLVVVCLNGSQMEFGFTLLGDGFMLISTVFYAFSSVLIRKFTQNDNPFMLSGYQFCVGGVVMILIGLATGGHAAPTSPASYLLLLYLACISAVAYSLWGLLLKYNDVSKVTVFSFMTQVFGVAFSAIILSEANALNKYTLIALILVCTGIFIVNRGAKAETKEQVPQSTTNI